MSTWRANVKHSVSLCSKCPPSTQILARGRGRHCLMLHQWTPSGNVPTLWSGASARRQLINITAQAAIVLLSILFWHYLLMFNWPILSVESKPSAVTAITALWRLQAECSFHCPSNYQSTFCKHQCLRLWTLEERRNRQDLIEVFKMFGGFSNISLI